MIVIDTGPVVAAANRKDDYHLQCVDLLQNFPGPLLLPGPLLTEIGYMLASRAGAKAEADFLRDVAGYAPTASCRPGNETGRARIGRTAGTSSRGRTGTRSSPPRSPATSTRSSATRTCGRSGFTT